ncbi:MAG: hypothetical protein KAK00_01310 [Nanoarchaeota archaeon]|nr:hypothetical protein [Nanoarchaeota archaeon]
MNKNYLMLFISIICLILISHIINAPDLPHNVKGRVFHSDGITGVDDGIIVMINNTNNNNYVTTQVYSPPFEKGWYGTTIEGTDYDTIIVMAWNTTAYGINTTTLAPTTTSANIVLNTTRPSETNVTIIIPSDHTMFNITNYFNVTVKVGVIGGTDGGDCTATISFSNSDVLKLAPSESAAHDIGPISLGDTKETNWNISGNLTGSPNITIIANCTNDGLNFDNLNSYTAYNITIQDDEAPAVELIYPGNNSKITASNSQIVFKYNVSDNSNIANCSLIINGKINHTNHTISKEITQNFTLLLTNNTYNWSINCTEDSTGRNTGSSPIFNLTIITNTAPTVTDIDVDDPIDLTVGSTTIIYCNATITDENGVDDIRSVNSTLYYTPVGVLSDDDNNDHYTNNTCENISSTANTIDYVCSFNVYYYADNGIWTCNISAFDNISNIGSDAIGTTVSELLAIDVSPYIIDYGEIGPGENSSDDFKLNITNFGNIDFNVTVDGFAREDEDNLSMNCTRGNISIEYQKYSIHENQLYYEMNNLSDLPALISNFTLPQRTNDTTYKRDKNHTYWKMGLPYGIQGNCAGFVVVTGIKS